MTSSVLENKIPHTILFLRESLHFFPPKFFGLHALFTILVLGLINYLLGHINMSF